MLLLPHIMSVRDDPDPPGRIAAGEAAHVLMGVDTLSAAGADAYGVEALATQVASTGAAWLMFTLGQNSGYFCSPDAMYDGLVEQRPSRLSERDLITFSRWQGGAGKARQGAGAMR